MMVQAAYQPLGDGAMIYDGALTSAPGAFWFEEVSWRHANAIVGEAGDGRGNVWFVQSPDGVWALRHYRRGGIVSRLIDDQYVWLGEARTRSFREWRLLAELSGQGLPVPPPVAARYQRWGPFYRADLITGFVDAPSLQTLMLEQRLSAGGWQRVGRVLRRFHDAGVYHADLNIRNILVRADGEVFVLDFDRGELRPPGPWAAQNLSRLERSIHKICRYTGAVFDSAGWQALMDGYHGGSAAA
jgi:3-deoxy-D-manno-octulosonic acid kinase